MDFNIKSRGAGSPGAILENASVAKVYGKFGDECLRCYGIDIRDKRTFVSAKVLRQVEGFVKDYGEEDAIGIIDVMFNAMYNGNWKGRPLGTSIFSKSFRWLADQFLLEAGTTGVGGEENTDGNGEHTFFDTSTIKSIIV